MAQYVVPPRKKKFILVKCHKCKALYAPDPDVHPYGEKNYYEKCPICGTCTNDRHNTIPLWRYNLIRYWRGLFNNEQDDDSSGDG